MDWNVGTGARTLWSEARGETLDGQQAVAHVLVNRLRSGKWGHSLYEVCTSEFHGVFQFSCWDRNDPNRAKAAELPDNDPLLNQLADMITGALNGSTDPTGGALYYYAQTIPAPAWVKDMTYCGKHGTQFFWKDRVAAPAPVQHLTV